MSQFKNTPPKDVNAAYMHHFNSHFSSCCSLLRIFFFSILFLRLHFIIDVLWLQGAVENLLERSTSIQLPNGTVAKLDTKSKAVVLNSLHDMSTNALRCLGFAYKGELREFASYDGDADHPNHEILLEPSNYVSIESELTFVGMVGLRVSTKQINFFQESLLPSKHQSLLYLC